jgi:hypothetical protein
MKTPLGEKTVSGRIEAFPVFIVATDHSWQSKRYRSLGTLCERELWPCFDGCWSRTVNLDHMQG